MTTTYKIVRMYMRGSKRTIARGLTLEEAQAHWRRCSPEDRPTGPLV
jgi:hypothetical protein